MFSFLSVTNEVARAIRAASLHLRQLSGFRRVRAHLSAVLASPAQGPRVPQAQRHQAGSRSAEAPPREGPQAARRVGSEEVTAQTWRAETKHFPRRFAFAAARSSSKFSRRGRR